MKVSIEKTLFAELSLGEEIEQERVVFIHKMWVVPACSYAKRALELIKF